ncbi:MULTISPECIES: acetylornithine deacetylase [unclassified Moraxella]|uniref:acetylornithine deacetylase n=1 Tax=unclassified Moraxella TaxID=2685852 RepID=UPI003AF65FED
MVYPQDTLNWLKKLISFDTTSRYSNLALINYVEYFCQSLELTPYLTFNEAQNKANLFVTVPATATGKSVVTGGFVLSGHTDVVPVDGQAWDTDPFTATIKDGKVYGRGACDMKGFIACCLNLLPQAVQASRNGTLAKPIHLAFSFDEEVGCLGVPLLLADLQTLGIQPEYCIVGEPTMMRLVTAHKGIQVYRCRVHGKSVHSSLTPQGVNAISYASRIINFIDELAETLKQRTDQDTAFDVPFSTLSVGTITGGTATNIVPNLCEFTFDYRNLPHMNEVQVIEPIRDFIATLEPKMQAVASEAHIELTRQESVPAMTDKDSEALQQLIVNLVDEKLRHKVAYATEGGQFTEAGIPTVICGCGSIEQAHKPNEFISLEQLQKCDKFLGDILANCLT